MVPLRQIAAKITLSKEINQPNNEIKPKKNSVPFPIKHD